MPRKLKRQAAKINMGAVEIRNYEGDGADLAELILRVWRANYAGRMWFPLWDREYFAWRLLDARAGGRDFMVAGYRDGKLAGCLLGEALDFSIGARAVRGTLSSFLSVDPEANTPTLALQLVSAFRKRHRERGMSLSLGITSSDRTLPNRKFWDSLAHLRPSELRYLRPLYFWNRVFDGRAVSRAGVNTFERWGSRAAGLIPWGWLGWRTPKNVRPYQVGDLQRCHAWLEAQAAGAHVRIVWKRERLELQLAHDTYTRTLLVEDETGRGAFLNYYVITWRGAREVRVGLIDLFAGDASLASQIDLLKAAGIHMQQEGVQLALMMASSAAPAAALLASGFVMLPTGSENFALFPDPNLEMRPRSRFHVLFT